MRKITYTILAILILNLTMIAIQFNQTPEYIDTIHSIVLSSRNSCEIQTQCHILK